MQKEVLVDIQLNLLLHVQPVATEGLLCLSCVVVSIGTADQLCHSDQAVFITMPRPVLCCWKDKFSSTAVKTSGVGVLCKQGHVPDCLVVMGGNKIYSSTFPQWSTYPWLNNK